ncbi:unnamed protein product [Mytilus coruscus]|uniref:Uncharacterized protein n=1 Tax=Mytilus coruscus TaxID=42192 RepID=A0A6J8BDV3_MYTCO|nr:unnamed protein product [Mytilus coruscus]
MDALKVRKRIEANYNSGREKRSYNKKKSDYWQDEIRVIRSRRKFTICAAIKDADVVPASKLCLEDEADVENLTVVEIKQKLKDHGVVTKIRKHDKLVQLYKDTMLQNHSFSSNSSAIEERRRSNRYKGVPFVGVEIPIEQFENLQCVAVARHKRHEIEVDEEGKVFELEADRNIKVRFPQEAFAGKTIVATKAVPWTHAVIENAAKKYKELHNIKTAGSYIDISCENTTKEDSDLEMYDFGWVVDKKLHKNQSVNKETLNRCSRWIVNNLNPDENELQLDDVFDSDFLEELKTKDTEGDKSRFIIRHLHESNSDSDFDKFLVGLKSSQPNVALRINSVKNQVVLSRNHKDMDPENNFASDFDPGHNNVAMTYRLIDAIGQHEMLPFPRDCYLIGDTLYPSEHPIATPYTVRHLRNQNAIIRDQRKIVSEKIRASRVYVEHSIRRMNIYEIIG